jgi:hypothetical protein
VDTAGRIWEGDSVQLATKEVGLKLIPWMRGGRTNPTAAERLARQSYRRGCECNRDVTTANYGVFSNTEPKVSHTMTWVVQDHPALGRLTAKAANV